ncbi:MAG TPA: hypothetical protein VMA35_05330 [Candidatus Sulfopaludibacter sp.]|nr:hypothetical protein [Candidatus Sulfopaludibacter sp.]
MDDWLDFLRRAGDKLGHARMTHVKVPVKIVCSCGQKYAFDVYPLNGQMPAPIKCPVCGVDGTTTANQAIAHTLQILATPPSTAPSASAPAPASAHLTLRPRSLAAPAGAANGEVEAWRQRALEAERRAEQVQAAAQASLAPHLVQALRETVVQELATQRRELLKAQEEAALEIGTIIRRLDAVQAPMQERLRAYEARIQELEKELSALNEENRELLKLKIDMIRRQLEVERVQNRLQFIPN